MKLVFIFTAIILLGFISSNDIQRGKQAPEIELKSPKGKLIKLSDLKGKVVLVDFWASWCGPCRKENPNIVEVYNKYKKSKFTSGRGFEILSVSLDRHKESWIKAIKTDGLIWKNHVWDNEGITSKKYKVSSIPTAFLINGDGEVVASGSELRGLGIHIELDKLLAE